jgi:hypothetical protein
MTVQGRLLRSIRLWLSLFIAGLVLSGITAFPLVHELHWLARLFDHPTLQQHFPALAAWIYRVDDALSVTDARYPFLAYGTDWLGFAHLVIAAAFLGPLLEPVRNKWVITFGLIACAAVPVLAFVAGPLRGIPLSWRLIDSSFGVLGAIPLLICHHKIGQINPRQPGRV